MRCCVCLEDIARMCVPANCKSPPDSLCMLRHQLGQTLGQMDTKCTRWLQAHCMCLECIACTRSTHACCTFLPHSLCMLWHQPGQKLCPMDRKCTILTVSPQCDRRICLENISNTTGGS